MIAALRRRARALPLRTGLAALHGSGRVGWSTECLLSPGAHAALAPSAVVHGQGLVVLLDGARLQIGQRSVVMRGGELIVNARGVLVIGSDTYIGSHSNLRVDGVLEIGSGVLIAQFVTIASGQYDIHDNDAPAASLALRPGRTVIADGAWIGANAVVLPDVTVGRGAVVGAGAVVTRDVPALAIVAGNPARIIGHRGAAQ